MALTMALVSTIYFRVVLTMAGGFFIRCSALSSDRGWESVSLWVRWDPKNSGSQDERRAVPAIFVFALWSKRRFHGQRNKWLKMCACVQVCDSPAGLDCSTSATKRTFCSEPVAGCG